MKPFANSFTITSPFSFTNSQQTISSLAKLNKSFDNPSNGNIVSPIYAHKKRPPHLKNDAAGTLSSFLSR